jgi:hypothetical protein
LTLYVLCLLVSCFDVVCWDGVFEVDREENQSLRVLYIKARQNFGHMELRRR